LIVQQSISSSQLSPPNRMLNSQWINARARIDAANHSKEFERLQWDPGLRERKTMTDYLAAGGPLFWVFQSTIRSRQVKHARYSLHANPRIGEEIKSNSSVFDHIHLRFAS